MFIDTEPIHDFLFVFQRRDGDAGLRLASAGIERASTIRPSGAAPLKNKKNCAYGALSINMPPLRGLHGSGPFHNVVGWPSVIASLVAGALILLLLFQQFIGVTTFSIWKINRGGWRPAFVFTGTALVSVVFTYLGLNIAYALSDGFSGSFPIKNLTVNASVEQVSAALAKWAEQNGYAPADQMRWDIQTVPKGDKLGQVALFQAWKPAVFDRWQMTRRGLCRISPHVVVQVIGSDQPLESVLTISTGRVSQSAPAGDWSGVMTSIEQAIKSGAATTQEQHSR